MPTVTDLIADLTTATEQMRQAVIGDDWAMAETIQKRRVVLIERIVDTVGTAEVTAEEAMQLNAMREQEAFIASRAAARHQALGKLLAETQGITGADKPSRMQKAYGILNR